MKLSIVLISLLIAVTEPTLAEQVQNARISLAFKPDSADVSACVSMFIARIFPGQTVSLPTDSTANDGHNVSVQKLYARQAYQEITMFARSKKDRTRLATGSCSVSRNGRVMSVSVRTSSVLKLARLQPGDIELAMK